MKLLPLISALLLSSAPVNASNTLEELIEPCAATNKAQKACYATGVLAGSFFHYKARCDLWKAGAITQEAWADEELPIWGLLIDIDTEKFLWNEGMKSALRQYPDCPIKPIP